MQKKMECSINVHTSRTYASSLRTTIKLNLLSDKPFSPNNNLETKCLKNQKSRVSKDLLNVLTIKPTRLSIFSKGTDCDKFEKPTNLDDCKIASNICIKSSDQLIKELKSVAKESRKNEIYKIQKEEQIYQCTKLVQKLRNSGKLDLTQWTKLRLNYEKEIQNKQSALQQSLHNTFRASDFEFQTRPLQTPQAQNDTFQAKSWMYIQGIVRKTINKYKKNGSTSRSPSNQLPQKQSFIDKQKDRQKFLFNNHINDIVTRSVTREKEIRSKTALNNVGRKKKLERESKYGINSWKDFILTNQEKQRFTEFHTEGIERVINFKEGVQISDDYEGIANEIGIDQIHYQPANEFMKVNPMLKQMLDVILIWINISGQVKEIKKAPEKHRFMTPQEKAQLSIENEIQKQIEEQLKIEYHRKSGVESIVWL